MEDLYERLSELETILQTFISSVKNHTGTEDSWQPFEINTGIKEETEDAVNTGSTVSNEPLNIGGHNNEPLVETMFDEEADSQEIVRLFFDEIDTDNSGSVTVSELVSALKNYSDADFSDSVAKILDGLSDADHGIDLARFSQAMMEIPRPHGQRVNWCKSLRLENLLAQHLSPGHFFDELRGIRAMTGPELDMACDHFCAAVKIKMKAEIVKLNTSNCSLTATEANAKFCMDGAFKGNFATLKNFHEGPESLVGSPNPNVKIGMTNEHLHRENAETMFVTTNYNVTTCPKWEWMFVVNPTALSIRYPHTPFNKDDWSDEEKRMWKGGHGRRIISLSTFSEHETAVKSDLKEPEVIGLRLYTGPMFNLYNAVLRKFPLKVFEELKGNQYETTIFVICSGIAKLSKITDIPKNRLLYRGLGGLILPEQFWKTENGFRGAVEWGLMSTTTDRGVAIQYSGVDKKRGTIFEISCGRIDIGAVLVWISQYPGEAEYLFPPLSSLEVVGEPRVEVAGMDEVVVFPLRVNVCLKGLSLEQIIERRKNLHLATVKNAGEELSLEISSRLSDFESRVRGRRNGVAEPLGDNLVGAPYAACSSGKVYFEVELLMGREQFWAGFAGDNFRCKHGSDDWMADKKSWCINATTCRAGHKGTWNQLSLEGWDKDGDVLGIALDIDQGSMFVSYNGNKDPPKAGMAFDAGIVAGFDAGSSFFPFLSNNLDTTSMKCNYNFGYDLATRPMRFLPQGFIPVASASRKMVHFNIDRFMFEMDFHKVATEHKGLDAEEFNDDSVYKARLNQVLDLKSRLLNKLEVLVMLWEEGASEEQLNICKEASCLGFHGMTLEHECPSYNWSSILSGWLSFCPDVTIPLNLPPCQSALIWEAALKCSGSLKVVHLGDVACNLSDLIPSLQLKNQKLHYQKFENAIAGLVQACAFQEKKSATRSEQSTDKSMLSSDLTPSNETICPNASHLWLTAVDFEGIEYSNEITVQMAELLSCCPGINVNNVDCSEPVHYQSILMGCRPPFEFSGLSFKRSLQGVNLRDCLEAGPGMLLSPIGLQLSRAHWMFVLERVVAYKWNKLDLSQNGLTAEVATSLSPFLKKLDALTELNLSNNRIGSAGGTTLAEGLIHLTAITALQLQENSLGPGGWTAVLKAVKDCSALGTINSTNISGLFSGGLTKLEVARIDDGLAFGLIGYLQKSSASLTKLDLSSNGLRVPGAAALAQQLSYLTQLATIGIANNQLGPKGAEELAYPLSALPRLQELNLSNNDLGAEGGNSLVEPLGLMSSLLALDLNHNCMGPTAVTALAGTAITKLVALTMLCIAANQNDSAGVLAVARSCAALSLLTRLELGFKGRLGGLNSDRYDAQAAKECRELLPRLGEWNRRAMTGVYMD